jgi:hypothetical protein
MFVGLVITYPVISASIVLCISIFLLAGYIRHRFGDLEESCDDCEGIERCP